MKQQYGWLATAALAAVAITAGSELVGQPPNRSDLRVRAAGRAVLDDFRVSDGAVVDDTTVLLIGSTDGPEDANDRDLTPNGWVLDLTRKTPRRRFTNGHSAPLVSVAVGHGMVATTSTTLDPVLRVSDLKSGKAVAEVALGEPDQFGNALHWFTAEWLRRSPRLAVLVRDEIQVFDPKAPREKSRYRRGARMDSFLFNRLAVAADDSQIACAAQIGPALSEDSRDGVMVWGTGGDSPTFIGVAPPKADNPSNWRTRGLTIGARGDIVATRGDSRVEVPLGKAEKDVPAERRGVVRIDPTRKSCAPTGMGTSFYTMRCAFDPTGKWLAVVGTAHPDGPAPKDDTDASELRVYEFATARLAYREQVYARMALKWVAYSPSGKRLCAATANGTLHWWDVDAP